MSNNDHVEIAIIGAGLAGIATAYYLSEKYKKTSIVLLDYRPAMSYTSAQSGDNYRNWWPHPVMKAFSDRSIELMQNIAVESDNSINMQRRGYLLATRRNDIDNEFAGLRNGFSENEIRVHDTKSSSTYLKAGNAPWDQSPGGVDVISEQTLIRSNFPAINNNIQNLIHIRRAGEIDGMQLGQFMLQKLSGKNIGIRNARVTDIVKNQYYTLNLESGKSNNSINADIVINAAGPYAKQVARFFDVDLPLNNIFQQKIQFQDHRSTLPRDLPFTIDIDSEVIPWSNEEKELLSQDPETKWLTEIIQGGLHCRPDGGASSSRIKLGWAYNQCATEVQEQLINDQFRDASFPEIILRRASLLVPELKHYADAVPTQVRHYGGYYTMTNENWPLIGPLNEHGAFAACGLSGFGTMTACAAGELCAEWVMGNELPEYAFNLSMQRYENKTLMHELESAQDKGLL